LFKGEIIYLKPNFHPPLKNFLEIKRCRAKVWRSKWTSSTAAPEVTARVMRSSDMRSSTRSLPLSSAARWVVPPRLKWCWMGLSSSPNWSVKDSHSPRMSSPKSRNWKEANRWRRLTTVRAQDAPSCNSELVNVKPRVSWFHPLNSDPIPASLLWWWIHQQRSSLSNSVWCPQHWCRHWIEQPMEQLFR